MLVIYIEAYQIYDWKDGPFATRLSYYINYDSLYMLDLLRECTYYACEIYSHNELYNLSLITSFNVFNVYHNL
jgi:hypothetical protein